MKNLLTALFLFATIFRLLSAVASRLDEADARLERVEATQMIESEANRRQARLEQRDHADHDGEEAVVLQQRGDNVAGEGEEVDEGLDELHDILGAPKKEEVIDNQREKRRKDQTGGGA